MELDAIPARPRREGLEQWRLEPAVDLDDVQSGDARGEVLGQHAEPAADLERDVVVAQLREPLDDAEDVVVDEEVLAELVPRADPVLAHPPDARLHRAAGAGQDVGDGGGLRGLAGGALGGGCRPVVAHASHPNTRAALAVTAASSSS